MLRTIILCVVTGALLLGCVGHPESPIVQYRTQYRFPLTSPGSKFGALPPPAQHTVRAEAGMAEITDVEKVPSAGTGTLVYKISFRNRDLSPPIYVAADGSLLNPDLSVAAGATADRFGIISGGPVTGVKLSCRHRFQRCSATARRILELPTSTKKPGVIGWFTLFHSATPRTVRGYI